MLEKGFRWLMDHTAYIPENSGCNILQLKLALYVLPFLMIFRTDFLYTY